MEFSISLLGVNGAVPAFGRFPTSQVVRYGNQAFLLDCGEGAQMQMQRFEIGRGGLNHICISHLHGDHIYGLPGLLTSMALNNRYAPLHIYATIGLEEMLSALYLSSTHLPYPLFFHVLDTTEKRLVFESKAISIFSFPLYHHLPTCGFLLKEKPRPLNLRKGIVDQLKIPYAKIPAIKEGADWQSDTGQLYKNQELTNAPAPPRSYAFCTDTRYLDSTVEEVAGVDILYHEATFGEEHQEQAVLTRHSTAKEAARVAKKAGVGKLILGHYSARYPNVDHLVAEARTIFPESYAGEEGAKYEIPLERRSD